VLVPGAIGCSGDDEGAKGDGLPTYSYDGTPGPETLFSHGVASGDPLPNAIILWTRVSPQSEAAIEVWWEIARDLGFEKRVQVGTFTTDAERDFTVKLDVTGLEAGATYYYRFFALGRESPMGRTKTAPVGDVAHLRFAVLSCASFAHGYFHAYRSVAERLDLDAVLHLGDYIYEYGSGEYGNVREYEPPHEILALADYRMRYAQYRRDPHLQEVHQHHSYDLGTITSSE
jgi:alkaline phosphatase D